MKERIEKILENEQLSASKFADAIGVQRSSISHILSGRNKPSLELVNKILDQFPNINADWLLLGKGDMISRDEPHNPESGNGYAFQPQQDPVRKPVTSQTHGSVPVKIVVFYSDNTFEEFRPK